MNKFLRILSLIFLGLVLLGSFAVVVVRVFYGRGGIDSFDAVMLFMCGTTALLAMGSFLYHMRKLRKNTVRKKLDETEKLLDGDLFAREVRKQRLPVILRIANILYGLWAALICIISLNEMFSPYNDADFQMFFVVLVGVFGYSFIYNIVGGLIHFIKHGN